MAPESRQEIKRLSEEVMDIVAEAAGRRLSQALEFVNDDTIKPLKALLVEAAEHVRHAPRCDGIDLGDTRCDCGAVAYLDRVETALKRRARDAGGT